MVDPRLPNVPLRSLVEGGRFSAMDRAEQYYRGTVYDGRAFEWDGSYRGFGVAVYVEPGYAPPLKARRPCARFDVAKVIVNRLTAFVLGETNHPTVSVPGDPDAEDYVRELARASNLWSKLKLARTKGGYSGTACLSWAIKRGVPFVRVHESKHVHVLRWADEDELRPAEVLKAYAYEVDEPTPEGGTKKVTLWRCHVWTEELERIYEPIPDEVQKAGRWASWPHRDVMHGFGFCPFYWIQNQPEDGLDGCGDFAGAEDLIDELNNVLSQTSKGTRSNVDPTTVVREDPVKMAQVNPDGVLRKGSGNVIYATNGAEYLELSGSAVDSGLKMSDDLERRIHDVCGVVKVDAEKLSGAAQSGKALEILYAPMLATCDTLREQYGDHGAIPMLLDMLRVARRLASAAPLFDEVTGEFVRPVIVLPPRIERVEPEESDEEGDGGEDESDDVPVWIEVERNPGRSETLELVWPPYFAPTWADKTAAVSAAQTANGGKPVISQRTSVAAVGTLFGVVDVDDELEAIHEESERALEQAQRAIGGGFADGATGAPPEDEDDEEGGDE